jgi:hypothetical protein
MMVVRTGKLSTNAAAIHHKVPILSKRIIRLAQTGCPITIKLLSMCVFTYREKNNIPKQFVKEKGMAGYLYCNPITASCKTKNLNHGRAQKLNRFIVNDNSETLSITMDELRVINKPECIYNVNEKGCSLCLHKQHQGYTWLKEMLTGKLPALLGHITLRGADIKNSCKLLGKLLHLHTQRDFTNELFFVYAYK